MAINTKRSFTEYVVSTAQSEFAIGFNDYNEPIDEGVDAPKDIITVTLDDVDPTTKGYTVTRISPEAIKLDPAVPAKIPPHVVRLQRETNLDKSFHEFSNGAKWNAQSMDENFEQIRHSQQESRDGFIKLRDDVIPLVDGLEEALKTAEEAAKAAQEAAEAAEDAAQVTRSASQVIDEGGLTQQELNNGVGSIAELLSIPNPKNLQVIRVLSRNAGTFKGGGTFIFHAGSTKDDGGRFFATASGSWHRISIETWLNLRWWGVVSDGVTDDQPAIMSAIEALGDLAFNNMSNPSESAFCTFYLPASDKSTVIKDTVWLLPYMRIIGDSANGGSLATLYDNNASIIETKFPLAENYKWAISTRNYVRATGELTTWDSNYSGSNYDNGIVTACFGSQVKDVVVVNKDITKRVYGGIRMQNSPQCVVDAYVRGFDVGVYIGGSWRSYVKADTECYKAGVVVFGDSNNAEINTYTHGNQNTSITPMAQQHKVFNGIDGTSGLENFATWKDKTYGTFLSYCYGFSATLISEYNDVGNLYGNSAGHVSSAYCELNKIGDAFFASAVTFGAISGVNNVKGFAFGSGSRVDLPTISPDHYSSSIRDGSDSRYNSEIICPVTTNLSGANVYFKNNTPRVFLNATIGKDTNNGATSNTPVKTVDRAIDIISKQLGSDSTIKSSSGSWSVIITDSSTYVPTVWSTITNDVSFEAKGGSPTIQFEEAIFWAADCKVSFKGVHITRANNNNFQTSSGGIIAKGGDVHISILEGNTACLGTPSLVSIDPDVTCNLTLAISGGTCAIDTNSRFVELSKTSVVASTVRVAIAQQITGSVESKPDFGVDVPIANILKAVIVNTRTSAKHVLP